MSIHRIKTLAKAQATQSEIEAVVGYDCSGPDEQEAIRVGRLIGMAELREKQYDRAMKGDTAAMTALGKHLLGQSGDGVQVNINITDILKRSMALRRGAVDVDPVPCIATRSDNIEVVPPGENDDGSGAAFEGHTKKNIKIEN